MSKIKVLTLALAIIISSFTVISATEGLKIDGKWKMNVDVNGQSIPATAVFKQSEKTFTGELSTALGNGKISNGKIDGSSISADVSVDAQGQMIDLALTGKVDKDKMSGTMITSDGMTVNFTAEKVKEEKKK